MAVQPARFPLVSDLPSTHHPGPSVRNSHAVGAALSTAAIGLFVIGTAWDVQWHPTIGRDRLLTAPHIVMLAGIALTGLISLAMLVFDIRHTSRAGLAARLRAVMGARNGVVLSGLGALLAAAAFPLDDYWHALYGIDVTLWAPFHVMIDTGIGLAGLGAVAQFAGELRSGVVGRSRVARELGCAAALSIMLATFMVLIAESAGRQGIVHIGDTTTALYPIVLGLALPIAVVCAAVVTRQIGIALLVAVLFVALRQLLFLFVPWATSTLATMEGLPFRPSAPTWAITPNAFPGASLVLVALAAEAGLWWGARRRATIGWVLLVVAAATVPAGFVDRPWAALLPRFYGAVDLVAVGSAAIPWVLVAAVFGTLVGFGLAVAVQPIGPIAATRSPTLHGLRQFVAMLAAVLGAILGGGGSVAAHDVAPESSTPARIGPYVVDVRYFGEPVGSHELPFEIVPVDENQAPTLYQVLAVPGPSTNAVPVRARMAPAAGHAGASGVVNLPVSGRWLLNIEVDGPLGPAGGDAPIVAALPAAAMPGWLAWSIGLLPVWALLVFVVAQVFAARSAPSLGIRDLPVGRLR